METILSWGSNSHYQLALHTQEDQSTPHAISPPDGKYNGSIACIGGGGAHMFILLTSGDLYLCGWNKDGQIGCSKVVNDVIIPTRVLGVPQVKRVACGWSHTLVCTMDGAVFVWGSNSFGQLGTEKIVSHTNLPVLLEASVFDGGGISNVACGMRHSGCVGVTGVAYSWGSGNKGQLGREGNHRTPGLLGSDALKGVRVVDLCMGNAHSILLSEDRQVFVCGDNSYGQCGMECVVGKPYILKPVKLVMFEKVFKIDCGWQHSLSLTGKGEVYSWGRCDYGQLGRDVLSEQTIKGGKGTADIERVELPSKIVDIKCGAQHCIVLSDNSEVYSWGWNEHGMCGNGKEENLYKPCLVGIQGKVVGIGCGDGTSFVVTHC